tara:strand:+ start:806 stop:3490 length:2685 start_codon:yes stop_codon:yes gene_type:complete
MPKTIADIRKEYPNAYQNVSDIELADAIYNKYYSDKLDQNSFYEQMFPNIAAKRVSEDIISPDDEFNENYNFKSTPLPFKPTTAEIAREAGVLTNDPATSSARFGASLGYDESQKALAIKNTLSKLYGQDIDVRKGRTGELEYFNPVKKQYALVDAPGIDLGDFADLGGDALVVIPDLAATIGVGVATGGTFAIPSGAVAAAAGEYARLKLGQKLYGINKDLTDEQLWNSVSKTGAISLAGGTAGLVGARVIKGVNNLIKGRVVTDDAVKVLNDTVNADEVATQINNTLDKAKINSKLKFTLAQSVDDADMLATQQSFENVKRLGYMDEFREFGREQAKSLNDYFSVLKSGFNTSSPANPISQFDTGVLIQNVVTKRNEPLVKSIIQKQKQSEDLLTKSVFRLPDGNKKITGVEARSIINDLGKTYKEQVDQAAKSLDDAIGVDAVRTDKISDAIAKLTTKEKSSFLNTAKVEGLFKPEIFEQLSKKDGYVTLSGVRETMQGIGKKIRDQEIGSVTGETLEIGKLKKLQSALSEQIKKDAGTEYLDELQKFNDLVITNKRLLNNDTISKLTAIDKNRVLKIADEDVFAETFKRGIGSGKVAREVYDVINQSPDALKAYKNSIYDFYKSKVLDQSGKPNLARHNAFIKDYEAPLKQFFNDAELTKIKRIGGLKTYIDNLDQLRKKTANELVKSFEGKLENLSPGEIFNKIYKPNNIGEIRKLKNILKNDPEVFRAFQRNVLTDLNERVMTNSDRLGMKMINARAFDSYLNGIGGERGYKMALKEVFDNEFINNLDVLNKALQISARKAPSRAAEGVFGSAFSDIIRARLGQFTTAGRLFTAARRIYKKASERVIANALLNPQSLKELVELKKLKPNTERAAIILGKLGGSIFITN